ncbi:MAG TPA: LnmK family bifunctional acyltransferase/decarboxylase [Kineosporiaceae bacterium]
MTVRTVPRPDAGVVRSADGSLVRHVLVTPGMCGPNSLFVGRLGDWTWDAVSAACDVDAYAAHTQDGAPTYLSFYYYRVRGSVRFHPLRLTFGDRLQVVSRVFGFGSESVLTVHRLRRDTGGPVQPLVPEDFYSYADEDCLYVETFNRWIARSRPDRNTDLVRSSPRGFRHRHLPVLPDGFSPRPVYARARRDGTFVPGGDAAVRFAIDYAVEPSRDLNGVGLLYFASYFSVVDWAVLRLWRRLGRDHRAFLGRAVLDHQLCYAGNADADAVLRCEVAWRPGAGAGNPEVVDVVIRDRASDSLLAVSTQRIAATGGEP